MKRYNNLYEKICSFENLHSAYSKARKCKRYRSEILKFSYNLEGNLLKLQEELLNQRYRHGPYREFIVNESKKRKIKAAPFRDRVVHHALCNIIEPIFDKGFIYDSYACRKNKGTHKAIKRTQIFLRSIFDYSVGGGKALKDIYCLQCDISKYFASVDHKILFDLIKKKIADKKVLWLIQEILNSSYDNKPGKGIPIGNLTSQLFANIYLNELDKFMKHELKIRYYLRYMDDFLIFGFKKNMLRQIENRIKEFLNNSLRLKLHPKKDIIFPINKGINFLGYIIFKDYKLLRKDTVKRFIRRTRAYQKKVSQKLMSKEKLQQSVQSWLAYAQLGNSWRLRKSLEKSLIINHSPPSSPAERGRGRGESPPSSTPPPTSLRGRGRGKGEVRGGERIL